jgi:hypothetical protein
MPALPYPTRVAVRACPATGPGSDPGCMPTPGSRSGTDYVGVGFAGAPGLRLLCRSPLPRKSGSSDIVTEPPASLPQAPLRASLTYQGRQTSPSPGALRPFVQMASPSQHRLCQYSTSNTLCSKVRDLFFPPGWRPRLRLVRRGPGAAGATRRPPSAIRPPPLPQAADALRPAEPPIREAE